MRLAFPSPRAPPLHERSLAQHRCTVHGLQPECANLPPVLAPRPFKN